MERYNLVQDPSLRSRTTSAYSGVNATLSVTEEDGFYGQQALVVTKSAKNGSGVALAAPVPVTAGLSYAFSAYVRIPQEIPPVEAAHLMLLVQWMNSLGTVQDEVRSATLEVDDDSTWYRLSGVWVAPPGTTFASMTIMQPLAGSEGEVFLVDALMIEQSAFVRGYINNIPLAEKEAVVKKALSAVPQVINGIKLGADIAINDLILNTIDENNTVWVCTNLTGWWGQTAPELPDITRGTEDGSYDVQSRLTARSITIEGYFIPGDLDEGLPASIDRLVSAINLSRKGGWLIVNENPTKAAWVRLSAAPEIRTTNARGKTQFSVQLKAGDPVKYHWNDQDPEGFTNVRFEAADRVIETENIGTADVTGVFTLTGPAGAGTRIYNSTTRELLTLRQPLRGAGVAARAQQVEAKDGVATIYTTEAHGLRPGDQISLLNMVIPFSESSQARTVTQVSEVFPYSVSFAIPTDDVTIMPTNGQIYLVNNDVLSVDTYNRSVTFNGENSGHRHRLTTMTDWIHIGSGTNVIEFFDQVTRTEVLSKQLTNNEVTLRTKDAHFLIPGEQVEVALPVDQPLLKKRLQGNVATITTDGPHGFSKGDIIEVSSSETASIITKSRDNNLATLTTQNPHGVSSGDRIVVEMPTSAVPVQKSLTGNVATIVTGLAHGFSPNDSVVVDMPTSATVVEKALTNNQATLTTATPHRFVVGDQITVAMPSGAAVTNKARSGSQAVLTTAAAHGFSVGDVTIISLPTTALISGTRSISSATRLVTLNTSNPHGFSAGDRITVSVGTNPTANVQSRTASSTECTLTTSANHNYAVGELITVTGINSRYNGTYYITGASLNTITYAKSGTAEATVSSSGSIQNNTIENYYNGSKIIESTPSSTSLTYRAWGQEVTTSSTALSSPTLTNQTNQAFNGSKTLVAVTATTFAYNF